MSVLANVKRISTPLLFIAAVVASQFSMVLPAQAGGGVGVATWTGEDGDENQGGYKFSNPGNWKEGAIPEDGDELILNDSISGLESTELENDLTDVEFSKVIVKDDLYYTVSGNPLLLKDGASLELEAGSNGSVYFSSGIKGAGSLSLVNWNTSNSKGKIDGELNAKDSYGVLGGDYGIKGITSLTMLGNTSFSINGNISFPITVEKGAHAYLSVYNSCLKFNKDYSSCLKYENPVRTISGDLNLKANLNVYVSEGATAKFTGKKSGSGKVVREVYSTGVVLVNGKKLVNPKRTIKLGLKSGEGQASYGAIYDNETGILKYKAISIAVYGGGLLKGIGTTETLWVGKGGIVAPGNSPGRITVTDTFTLDPEAIYQAEILDSKNYDQIKAKTVALDGATLQLSFLKGGKVAKGDTFTLINNTGSAPIDGTFDGIDEGDKITLGKAVFAVTYKGGSGDNDFVLTALNDAVAPGTPNTGFQSLTIANPAIVAIMGLAAAGGVLYLRRAMKK